MLVAKGDVPSPAIIFPMQLNFNLRKLFLPGVREQPDGIAARDGKKQFEILAPSVSAMRPTMTPGRRTISCLQTLQRVIPGIAAFKKFSAHPTAFRQDMPQISRWAVAQIGHGMDVKMFRQPLGFGRFAVQSPNCLPKNEPPNSPVTTVRLPAFAPLRKTCFPLPIVPSSAMRIWRYLLRVRGRFPADDGHAIFFRQRI